VEAQQKQTETNISLFSPLLVESSKMPDRNGLSLWAERDANFQLEATLHAFERAYYLSCKPDTASSCEITKFSFSDHWMEELKSRTDIKTVTDLGKVCRAELSKMKKQGFLHPPNENNCVNGNKEDKENDLNGAIASLWQSPKALQNLSAFLPSALGFQCIALAEEAVTRRENGTAIGAYVHRGSVRGEKWIVEMPHFGKIIEMNGSFSNHHDEDDVDPEKWILDVDCAGYVRNVLKSVTGTDFLVSLSDRDYMRAKGMCVLLSLCCIFYYKWLTLWFLC